MLAAVDITLKMPGHFAGDKPSEIVVQGWVIGHHFGVHRQTCASRTDNAPITVRGWNVTHLPSGFACVSECPTKSMAMKAAKRFAAMAKDWSFTDPLAVKKWSKSDLALVKDIIVQAKWGEQV